MYNYKKSRLSPYDPTKLAIHSILRPEDDLISNCGPNVKKTISFDDVVHFIDEENIVTYVDFDCGVTFLPETPTKIRQINREQNYISRSCEKPQCIASNNQHVCPVDEQHSSNIFPKNFFKKHEIEKKNFLKSMILNKKVFLKSMILNQFFFVLSDFELKFL